MVESLISAAFNQEQDETWSFGKMAKVFDADDSHFLFFAQLSFACEKELKTCEE